MQPMTEPSCIPSTLYLVFVKSLWAYYSLWSCWLLFSFKALAEYRAGPDGPFKSSLKSQPKYLDHSLILFKGMYVPFLKWLVLFAIWCYKKKVKISWLQLSSGQVLSHVSIWAWSTAQDGSNFPKIFGFIFGKMRGSEYASSVLYLCDMWNVSGRPTGAVLILSPWLTAHFTAAFTYSTQSPIGHWEHF